MMRRCSTTSQVSLVDLSSFSIVLHDSLAYLRNLDQSKRLVASGGGWIFFSLIDCLSNYLAVLLFEIFFLNRSSLPEWECLSRSTVDLARQSDCFTDAVCFLLFGGIPIFIVTLSFFASGFCFDSNPPFGSTMVVYPFTWALSSSDSYKF